MALMVKSRSPRSCSTVPRVRVTSTVRPSCTTRQAPWRSDSGNGEPPAREASPRAARPGSPSTITSMSATGRPTSRSRTLPPTSHAPSSGTTARRRSSSASDDEMLDPPAPRRDVGDDLVADGVRPAGPLMRADGLVRLPAQQHDLVANGDVALIADQERQLIHADGRHHRPPPASGEHVHPPRQQPRDAVRVAGGHETDPDRAVGREAMAIAGAVPRLAP